MSTEYSIKKAATLKSDSDKKPTVTETTINIVSEGKRAHVICISYAGTIVKANNCPLSCVTDVHSWLITQYPKESDLIDFLESNYLKKYSTFSKLSLEQKSPVEKTEYSNLYDEKLAKELEKELNMGRR